MHDNPRWIPVSVDSIAVRGEVFHTVLWLNPPVLRMDCAPRTLVDVALLNHPKRCYSSVNRDGYNWRRHGNFPRWRNEKHGRPKYTTRNVRTRNPKRFGRVVVRKNTAPKGFVKFSRSFVGQVVRAYNREHIKRVSNICISKHALWSTIFN